MALLVAFFVGCGTTRMTDTQRTATEQLLISNSVDQAVSELDFSVLAGKSVFFDPQYLDGPVDRGYLVSSLRQQLLACGCNLQEDRSKATYVVEARSGGVGTDRHSLLVGIPQMALPSLLPGQPSQIPEIPFAKKTDQNGYAKIAVFAYNRQTGKPVWQSGVVQAMSTSKDVWVLGTGPFQRGSIRRGTEFAGQQIVSTEGAADSAGLAIQVTEPATWTEEKPTLAQLSKQLAGLLCLAVPTEPLALGAIVHAQMAGASGGTSPNELAAAKQAAAPPAPPAGQNPGGQAETQPRQAFISGIGMPPPGG